MCAEWTRSAYREYIASEEWRRRRRDFLDRHRECAHCGISRESAIRFFDQDLHVHHRSYARIGTELDEDLLALCRLCHEVETFGAQAAVRLAWVTDLVNQLEHEMEDLYDAANTDCRDHLTENFGSVSVYG